jgi:hypothetical protein
MAGWPGWSDQFRRWFELSVEPLQQQSESADTFVNAELVIGRMLRSRQREWDPHFIDRFSDGDLSTWTQLVADWDEPEGSFELGPEFAVAATDFGASLDPASATRMLRQLLREGPDRRMTAAISDLIDGLPLDLCRQQHDDLVELFDDHRMRLAKAGKAPLDKVSVSLFKALWDINLDKEKWLYNVLTDGTESDDQLYGSALAVVMVSQRTTGEIRTTIRRLQTLRDHYLGDGSVARRPVGRSLLQVALRDLEHYLGFLERESGTYRNELAILTSSSAEVAVREVRAAAEGHLDAGTILVDFSTSQLIIGGQHVPTRRRHGF